MTNTPDEEIVGPVGGYDLKLPCPRSLDDLYGRVRAGSRCRGQGSGLRLTTEVTTPIRSGLWTGKTRMPFICPSPTCVTNAFNLKMCPCCTGARLLEKGEVFRGSIRLTPGTM